MNILSMVIMMYEWRDGQAVNWLCTRKIGKTEIVKCYLFVCFFKNYYHRIFFLIYWWWKAKKKERKPTSSYWKSSSFFKHSSSLSSSFIVFPLFSSIFDLDLHFKYHIDSTHSHTHTHTQWISISNDFFSSLFCLNKTNRTDK